MNRIERDENGYEFQPTTWTPDRQTPPSGEALVRLLNADWGQIGDAFRSLSEALESVRIVTAASVHEAATARRRDTLHREAAAALGRGDRATHRKKLAELRRLPRRHP